MLFYFLLLNHNSQYQPTDAPTHLPTPKPTKEPKTDQPTSSAPTGAPSIYPTFAPTPIPGPVNCSEYQEKFKVPDMPVTIHYVVNAEEGTRGTFSAKVVYEGQGWVGFGVSPTGGMNGTVAIVGIPGAYDAEVSKRTVSTVPSKFFLGGRAQSLVSLMPSEQQTLGPDSTVVQNSTHTILAFTKFLEEEGEPSINSNGVSVFVVAVGFDNVFSYHTNRASFLVNLLPCIDEVNGKTSDEENEIWGVTASPTSNSLAEGDVPLEESTEGVPNAIEYDNSQQTMTGGSGSSIQEGKTSAEGTIDVSGSVTSVMDGTDIQAVLNQGYSDLSEQETNVNVNGPDINTNTDTNVNVGRVSSNRPGIKQYEPADSYLEAQKKQNNYVDASTIISSASRLVSSGLSISILLSLGLWLTR